MKTLKELYRERGFAVNKDDQKGIGNKAIDEQLKVFRRFFKLRLELADSIDESELDSHARSYLNGAKGELDKLLEEVASLCVDESEKASK